MPIYDFVCPECGEKSLDCYASMRAENPPCPACLTTMVKLPVRIQTDLREFRQPIEMLSIAMENPDEIREFARKCPNVEISQDRRDPNYGVPVARNRKAKLQALKAAGYQEINSERVRR